MIWHRPERNADHTRARLSLTRKFRKYNSFSYKLKTFYRAYKICRFYEEMIPWFYKMKSIMYHKNMDEKILYMVIPCYNEEEVLPETSKRLKFKMTNLIEQGHISKESRILFVNDGSSDNTWQMIKELHTKDSLFSGLSLTRNKGHQNALMAGLMYAKDHCDISISMDADLQDDIEVIDGMIAAYEDGAEIVYGVRDNRDTDTAFKRNTALFFYRLMEFFGASIISNHADFRLMSKRALIGLSHFKESNLFIRGLVPMIGYKTAKIYYKRGERFAGESKYPLKKMVNFAFDGITSLSVKPIRMITGLGGVVFLISIILLIWSIIEKIIGNTVPGWSSLMVSLWFLGGLLILSIGIVGEYIGKIYLETKGRPRYLIDEIIDQTNEK